MGVPSSTSLPVLPARESLFVGRPARARDASALADAMNHIESWRFRGWTRSIVEVNAGACPAAISASSATPRLPPGPTFVTEVTRVPHLLRSDADNLWVCIGYQASAESSTKPRIDVQLYTLAGALLDIGCRWDHTAGNLPTAREYDQGLYAATGLVASSFVYPVQWVHTGTTIEDDRRTEGTPTSPRLLSLAAATPRSRVEVRVTSRFARVVSVSIWEWPKEVL